MENADIHKLALIDWQLFGTLTFKSVGIPERVRIKMFFAFVRETAREMSVYFPRLIWCLRLEKGESTGRWHFHCLMAGLSGHVGKSTCFFLMDMWEKFGGGMARIYTFNPSLNGLGYITKCLSEDNLGGHHYESSKFGFETSQLMLSHSAERIIASRAARRSVNVR